MNTCIDYIPFTFFPYIKLPILDSKYCAIELSSITYPSIKSILKKYKFQEVDLVLIDYPNLAFMKKYITSHNWVYRITDNYSKFNSAPNSITEVEDYVNSFVKKIVVTSKPSQDMVKNRWNRNSFLM